MLLGKLIDGKCYCPTGPSASGAYFTKTFLFLQHVSKL